MKDQTTLAAALLKDVPRWGLVRLSEPVLMESPAGDVVRYAEVLTALSRALDPAIAEQAGELAQSDDPKVMLYHGEYVEALRSLLTANAALRAERDALVKDKRWIMEERDRTFALMLARAEAAEAKVAEYETEDGMEGAIVHAIRLLLNSHNVPAAAFIDDHVGNAIAQRDAAEAKVEKLRGALQIARVHVANNAEGWSVSRGAARDDLTIVDASLATEEGHE